LDDQTHREFVYRPSQLHERRQLFIGVHNETLKYACTAPKQLRKKFHIFVKCRPSKSLDTSCEEKSSSPRLRLERFLLVRRLKSIARRSSRHGGSGDFLSMMDEAMTMTPIVLVLIIVLFGFDSTRQGQDTTAT
jgi:hypothetical protein